MALNRSTDRSYEVMLDALLVAIEYIIAAQGETHPIYDDNIGLIR